MGRTESLEKDQKTEEEYPYYSYSPSPQPTGKRKLSKKSTKSSSASSSSPLGKDAGKTSLEKDAGKTSLEKGADKTSLEKGVDKISLEKGVTKEEVRRTRVAKPGKAESLKEVKEQMRAGWRSRGRQGKRETMTSLWKRTTSLALSSKKPLNRNQQWWLTGTIQSKSMAVCQKKCQGIEFPPGTCQCSHPLLCEHQGETAGSGEGCHHPALL